ncbi:DUF397 domain-containing protein [Streptomyces sp. NPDC001985]|uniref:DUF397 domain-containing protein n=1 Tax=Streptomyces sp. NPDC001985 TaxID=3154406 RepID=UPI0033287F87
MRTGAMDDRINWQKSSFSGSDDNQNCVELAGSGGVVRLRESEDPERVLIIPVDRLRAFLLAVKAGEFDHLTRPDSGPV